MGIEVPEEDRDDYKQSVKEENYVMSVNRDPRTKTMTKNLRIREDKAVYLSNLDPNAPYFDPKSRSIRDNPNPNQQPER